MFGVSVPGPIPYESIVYHVVVKEGEIGGPAIMFLIWDPINGVFKFIDAGFVRPVQVPSQNLDTQRKIQEIHKARKEAHQRPVVKEVKSE